MMIPSARVKAPFAGRLEIMPDTASTDSQTTAEGVV